MNQGDLVELIDWPLMYPSYAVGIVVGVLDDYCWVKFAGIVEIKWCHASQLKVINESR